MIPNRLAKKMKEHFLFAFQFDNHIFCDLSPFSLVGVKNECTNDKCMSANWNSRPKTLLKIKAHFIDFIGLHSVQHVTIVSIKCFHLLIVVFGFFQEVHQLLSVLSSRDDLLIECFCFFKHVMSLVDCLVNLLDGVLDVELSCQALCFSSLYIPLYFAQEPFRVARFGRYSPLGVQRCSFCAPSHERHFGSLNFLLATLLTQSWDCLPVSLLHLLSHVCLSSTLLSLSFWVSFFQ